MYLPLFSLDRDGKICAVRYHDLFRDAKMPLPPKEMKSFYKAYYHFSSLLDDKRTSFWYKMKPGEAITSHGDRVLHGRSPFVDTKTNPRLLQCAFFNWDCVHSKMRLLAEQLGEKCSLE